MTTEMIELENLKHKNKMRQLKYIRETERMKHEWELERGRIHNAEMRKNEERRHYREMEKRGN